jgi:VDE lipocalin domain
MRASSVTMLQWIVRCLLLHGTANAFVVRPLMLPSASQIGTTTQFYHRTSILATLHNRSDEAFTKKNHHRRSLSTQYVTRHDENQDFSMNISWASKAKAVTFQAMAAFLVLSTCWSASPTMALAETTKPEEILSCLLEKCPKALTSCVLNPKCLANVVCLNTCGDNIDCQIKCGDYFENPVVGEFNKCVVSDMSCVKQRPDDGSYPLPDKGVTVPKFDTSFFNGRLYITAGAFRFSQTFRCSLSSLCTG